MSRYEEGDYTEDDRQYSAGEAGQNASPPRGRFKAFIGGVMLTIGLAPIAAEADLYFFNGDHNIVVGEALAGMHFKHQPQHDTAAETDPSTSASASESPSGLIVPASPKVKKPHKSSSPKPLKRDAPLIILDPGHDGRTHSTIDPQTGLEDQGYMNLPETDEMYGVALTVRKMLKSDGYHVLITKGSSRDTKSFRQRADVAMYSKADLEVSIHDDHTRRLGFQAVYGQFVGGYRGGGKHPKVVCQNSDIANKSHKYAVAIAQARTQAQGHKVTLQRNNFDTRLGLEPGNLSIIQLFDCIGGKHGQHAVPEVYNEMGALTGGDVNKPVTRQVIRKYGHVPVSAVELWKYATGLANGIEQAVPIPHRSQ